MTTPLHHCQVTSRPVEPVPTHVVGKKRKGWKPSPEYIRAQARVSTEGGTGYCYVCKERFSMTYLREKVLDFPVGRVDMCLDCKTIWEKEGF